MFKYLKYFISTITLVIGIYICSLGSYYPTLFFIGFSLLVILGDMFLGEDISVGKYAYPILLNVPIYINFPLLLIFLSLVVFVFGDFNAQWLISFFNSYLYIDIIHVKESATLIDKISLIALISLNIGIMGTVPGHELTHRKRNKIDMFMGNWLLALSWDCTFAIEHVYGHHKNVGLPGDLATAKRGENLYAFILRAIIKEQRDAWLIELDHLKRREQNPFSIHNRMILGYLRSLILTIVAYMIGGLTGMLVYLLCAFIAKSLLEVINYVEHYGLVRAPGEGIYPRHSWNSNKVMSSIYLYNVTRHSAHHEKSNLTFWELEPYQDAPMMPQGYLSMIFIAIFLPFLFHRMMVKKLKDWDNNYASNEEREIAAIHNKNSGITLLAK